ncbi:Tc toxin subunit A-related protein [Halorubrum salsamenti]|uniref:Tc toxin subunit A-related protein n=1 Tax=Halorubrum salsamenti TaxID=2583990 RepID=UPI00119EE02D|nr:tetratricopeptide repeat protein [Halorubrum salsamenti]
MTGPQFPANYVSTVGILSQESPIETVDNTSLSRITEIRSTLEDARDAYARAEYRKAIEKYEQVRSLVFELVDPRDSAPWHAGYDDTTLPMGEEVYRAIAETGLQLAEDIRRIDFKLESPVVSPETEIPSSELNLEDVGYTKDDPPLADLDSDIRSGIEKLNSGATASAIELFRGVLDELDDPATTAEKETAGTAALNLSTALTIANDEQRADEAAARAESLFADVGDEVALSQARHNRGATLSHLGEHGQASEHFEEARSAYENTVENGGGTEGGGRLPLTESSIEPIIGELPSSSEILPGERTGPQERGPSSSAVVDPGSIQPTMDLTSLSFLEEQDPERLNIRWSDGSMAGIPAPADTGSDTWELGVKVGSEVRALVWEHGSRPDPEQAMETILRPRVDATGLEDLLVWPEHPAGQSVYLTHVYAFAVPVGLGDCHRQLGEYERAEEYYLKAADYEYLNRELEATNLWGKLAKNVRQWGDSVYRENDLEKAMQIYRKLLTNQGSVPQSPLYQKDAFQKPSREATTVIENLADPSSVEANPSIMYPILITWARWQNLNAGLDFWGSTFIPTHTFEYLRQVARTLAKQGIQAERSYIDFKSRAEREEARRRELEQTAEMAEKKVEVSRERYEASKDETEVYEESRDLAETRRQNAQDEKNKYQTAGWYQYRAESAAAAGRSGWDENEIRKMAEKFESGESISGSAGKRAAAETYLSGQKSYEYQLERLENDAEELRESKQVAEERLDVAKHRQEAARLEKEAAKKRAELARDSLRAFENETFTPELWTQMAEFMRDIAQTYHDRAVEVAKLMERAYNFENDTDHSIIGSDYGIGEEGGLLGSDALLTDIDGFTHRLVTETGGKTSRLKDVISVANDYPFQFHQFQQTGELSFETLLYDFDRRHPGFHAQRVQAVELEIAGIIPSTGVRGTLRAGGFSRYRQENGEADVRIHAVDTLALSGYEERQDHILFRVDPEEYGLFEGHGVATTWHVDLPQRANNFDFDRIRDIRLVVYYEAQYDPGLAKEVESRQPLPGELTGAKDFQLRYDFPESWYAMLDDATMTFEVTDDHMPQTQESFKLDTLSLVLETAEGVDASNVDLSVSLPGSESVSVTTDADGQVTDSGTRLGSVLPSAVLGEWEVSITPPDGSALADSDGGLEADAIEQLLVLTEYDFQYSR